ncbi:MAG TPA: DinB family protein [Roseiflexaceae bacterium]
MSDATKANLDSLAAFPDRLKRQVQGLGDAALRFRPGPAEWSVVEVVGHLADVEALYTARIRQMLATDHPTFPPFDPDATVRQRDYQNKQIGFLLITFAERRAEHLELLRVLRPAQLARTGLHPTRGAISVADSIAILAWHDGNHSGQIAANLAAFVRAGER